MADGRIIIETDLDQKGIEKGLKDLESNLKGLSGLGSIFGELSKSSSLFGKAFGALGSVMSSTVSVGVAGVGTLVVAFNKLYEASKQNFFDNLKDIGTVLQPAINLVKSFTAEILQSFSSITGFQFSFSSLITEAIEFESKMAQVAAIMNVTGEGINQLTMTAREFGASTRYTATQVAEAFTYMGMAGWSAQESITGISDILNLATVGATQLGLASDIVTDGLTQLGMSASQAGNFTDYMSATITRSNTNVEMMGETLKYAGSVAGTLGVSMQDLSVSIGLMAGAGVKASRAGTALRTLMANLSAPTDTVAGAMDRYGISLITAYDGSVDLDATLRQLRESLKSLPLVEQTKACKDLAGKTGMTGLMAIVNATDAEYEKLTESVANSTESVSYFNENCARMGIVGEEATSVITMLREAYEGSEVAASALNLTTQDLALVVQSLGAYSAVTSENVTDLLNVFSKIKAPTEEQASVMKKLGLTYREVNDDAFDYSKTCAEVDSSIIGLSQSQKEQIKSQLNSKMTMEEANVVLKQYGLEAQNASTGQIDLVANLNQLRETFGGMSESARAAALEQLGLSASIDEVNSIVAMSDSEFAIYCENLELAKGLTEKLATAMDETTKGSLLRLSSAMTDVGIHAFGKFKEGIVDVSEALTTFFSTWRGEKAEYAFSDFNNALDGLLDKVKNLDLAGAIGTAINGMVNFINISMPTILSIGGEIVTQICNGIINNKDKINEGVSSTIKQISNWISSNAGQVREAGEVILNAISNGIEDNKDNIRTALEAVAQFMDSWVIGSASIKAMAGNFADIFISSFVEQAIGKATLKMGELATGMITGLGGGFIHLTEGMGQIGLNVIDWIGGGMKNGWNSFTGWFTGQAYADSEVTGKNTSDGFNTGIKNNNPTVKQAAKEMGDNVTKGAQEGVAPLEEVLRLQNAMVALRSSVAEMNTITSTQMTGVTDTIRTSFLSISNIINNQMASARNVFTTQCISMGAVARNQMNNVANIIQTYFSNISNVVNNQMASARNNFTSQMLSMSAVTRNQANSISSTMRTQFVNITNIVNNQSMAFRNQFTTQCLSMAAVARNQCPAIADCFRTNFLNITSIIRNQMSATRDIFTSKCLSMASVARNQANAITESFRNCANQMHVIGSQIGAGLRNGLASQRGSIMATANSIANGVASAMRKALDIHSPSRVTREIGKYTIEGLEVGMNKEMPTLDKSVIANMENMAARMKAAVDMETSKVSATITRNVVSSPGSVSNNDFMDKLANVLKGVQNVTKVEIDGKEIAKTTAPFMNDEIAFLLKQKKRG